MKKLLIILFAVLITHNSEAQITLEQSYADSQGLSIIKLENSGHKYLQYDLTNQIVKLYNLDHSIFKTISLPTLQPSTNKLSISYISENLFNSDNLIEIVCSKKSWSPTIPTTDGEMKVINENGSVIFSGDSMVVVEQRGTTYYGYNDKSPFIYNTTNGTKMILYSYKPSDKGFKVYSLPGTLVASINQINDLNLQQLPFPNPTNNNITIAYRLPLNRQGKLVINDMSGKIILEYSIDTTFDKVIVETNSLVSGNYYYSIYSDNQKLSTGKFVVTK